MAAAAKFLDALIMPALTDLAIIFRAADAARPLPECKWQRHAPLAATPVCQLHCPCAALYSLVARRVHLFSRVSGRQADFGLSRASGGEGEGESSQGLGVGTSCKPAAPRAIHLPPAASELWTAHCSGVVSSACNTLHGKRVMPMPQHVCLRHRAVFTCPDRG